MSKRKKSGPSCLGSLILLCVIVLGLKIVYDRADVTEVYESTSDPAMTETEEGINSAEAERESLYDVLLRELSAYAAEVSFDYDCTDELFETFERVCGDHPELFWLNGSGTSQKVTRGNEVTVTLTPKPILTLVEILKYQEELDAAVQTIVSLVDQSLSDYEKILYIHDYIVKNTEYDSECAEAIKQEALYDILWQSSSAYGCLVKELAVCSGYSAAFQLLMNELGVPCTRISGEDLENGTPHEWNCVMLDGKWYFVDVTWDDPAYENNSSSFKDAINYEYFMISSDVLLRTHKIADGEEAPECTDNSRSYYIYHDRYLEAYDFDSAAEMIKSQAGRDMIEIQFANAEEAAKACAELFDEKRFYEIEGISAQGIVYSTGQSGLLRIKPADESIT